MEQNIEMMISQNLIELRKNRGLKQSDLSEKIGYSDKTISRWENGTSVPDITTLVKLAEFYDVSLTDLIHENAVGKITKSEHHQQELIIQGFSTMGLTILTVWLIAMLIYFGRIIMFGDKYWEVFICAIPLSLLIAYRTVDKIYTIKWLNILLLSLALVTFLTAIYLILLAYNFWQIFLLSIPLEGIFIINTLFKKKERKKK